MATSAVHEIERQFAELSREDQLIVLERLVHQFRMEVAHGGFHVQPFVAPASDPAIHPGLERATAQYNAPGADLLSEAWWR